MVRVTIVRQYGNNITQNFRFWVRNVQAPPEVNNSIKMEVGIEDCLHIEFEYAKSKYSLKARALLRFGVCVCVCSRGRHALTRDAHLAGHADAPLCGSPLAGCCRGQDLLSAGAHQDQAHGG